jgi:type VI secretion system protein ImpK
MNTEKAALDDTVNINATRSPVIELKDPPFILTHPTVLSTQETHPLLLTSKLMTHHPKAGINPIVDAAAYLFSNLGKLKQLTSPPHLHGLHLELVAEINIFQDALKTQGYSTECIVVSRYALCATLDDIIMQTPWGNHGQWDPYSLLTVFNQDSTQQERFFLILERIIKDPALYIDVMELMYICLSLGYKGSFRSSEFSHHQLEKITHSLYKRIRAHQGDYSKTLSPFPVRHSQTKKPLQKVSYWFTFLVTACIIMLLFIGLGYLLDTISNQAYEELMHIGKSILYESHST